MGRRAPYDLHVGAAPAEGTILLGKLRVEEVLGEGGMGVVCKAHHLHLDQPVAIKFLLTAMITNKAVVARFLREAQASVRLRSEHVAKVIDVGRLDDGAPYMVMEYLEGADLGAIIKHYGPQEPEIAADLMLQACEGIAEAHRIGIIHRDIKPSNFFITRRPDGTPLLKILDFGISKAPQSFESELTKTSSVIGTPAYMAPEQMRSARNADHRSDLWSMGIVLYQTIEGRRPFESEAYSEMCLKVGMDAPAPIEAPLPPGFEDVILRCLEKNPDRRYQNVAELAWGLVPFATDPELARGSAERASRILGIKVAGSGTTPVPSRITGEMSAPSITPMPETRAARASRQLQTQANPGSNSGSWPGTRSATDAETTPGGPMLPLLSAGSLEVGEDLPHGGKAHPTSVSAGAGQVSASRSMPVSRPSRRGWVLGLVAVAGLGVGAFVWQQAATDEAPRPAAGPPVDEVAPAPTPVLAPTPAPIVPPAETATETGTATATETATETETETDTAIADKPPKPRSKGKSKPKPKRARTRPGGGVFDQRE